MTALLFGSIGTIADTSELQREAFNAAFLRHGLDWSWDRETYRALLASAGGQARIEAQASEQGIEVDAAAVHATKSALFQEMMMQGRLSPRPGVLDAIHRARTDALKLGFITTTSRANVDTLLAAINLPRTTFDLVTSGEDAAHGKPAPDIYHFAAERLAVSRTECTAIEDNVDGARAARDAGVFCIAWPNANTADHDFGAAPRAGENLFETIFPATVAAQ